MNHAGDCREIMRRWIAEGVRVQTCVTSPPYWGLRDYGHAGQLGLESTPAEYVANMVEVFGLVRELLADDGTLWLNLGDTYAGSGRGGNPEGSEWAGFVGNKDRERAAMPHLHSDACEANVIGRNWVAPPPGLKRKDLIGIPWRVAFALQADGWYLRSDIIWHKPNPMPESVTDRPTKAHEYLFLLAKSERYYYDAAAIAERAERAGSIAFNSDTRNRRSVWTIPTRPYDGAHFAVFPRALIEPCILAGSRAGDVVLDPFMGSGTTAQVAQALGRRWLGCELNTRYIELQERRTAQAAFDLNGSFLPRPNEGNSTLANDLVIGPQDL